MGKSKCLKNHSDRAEMRVHAIPSRILSVEVLASANLLACIADRWRLGTALHFWKCGRYSSSL